MKWLIRSKLDGKRKGCVVSVQDEVIETGNYHIYTSACSFKAEK